MSVHLATSDGILCATAVNVPARSVKLEFVSCIRCAKELGSVKREEDDAAADRRQQESFADAASTLGVDHLWDMVSDADNATLRMTRDILGSVLVGLVEMDEAGDFLQ